MTVPEYNYGFPAISQNDDWSCAPTSTRWALCAYGRSPSEQWLESSMLAEGVVSVNDGLLDATGRRLSQWLNTHYGEYGYLASHDPAVTFDDVAEEAQAQHHPLVMGGRAWYHWTGVRWYDSGKIILANPASGWKGVAQQLTRQQFEHLGPWSMVRLTHPQAESGQPSPEPGPEPGDPYAPWRSTIGSGILDLMAADGVLPAQHASTWLPLGQHPADVEEAMGLNGTIYRWIMSSSQGFRFRPT